MTAPSFDPSATLERNYELILRICNAVAYRWGLGGADAEEFSSWAVEQLVDRDYATIRRFGGRGPLKSFLSATLTNLCHDYRNRFWGRWRPSAAAVRLGAAAVRLERLVYRDRLPIADAVAALRSSGADLDAREARSLLAQIPVRWARSSQAIDTERLEAPGTAEDRLEESERERALRKCSDALNACLAELDPEDQIVIRMVFRDQLSVADTARALRVDQKPLYRRLETLRGRLREALVGRGITPDLISVILDSASAR